MLKKSRILVTGGSGFLGKSLIGILKENNYQVYSCSRRENIDILDFSSFLALVKKIKPEYLIHCAAHVGGIAYNAKYPVEVFEDNINIGLNIVRACDKARIGRLINIMPNCTYPGDMQEYEESKWWDGPMHETVLTYGLPRKIIWGACFAYCQKNPDFKPVHLIFPNMYGPGDHFDEIRSHALGALIAKIIAAKDKKRDSVKIWGTGKPIREWLYVKDGAAAILKTLENIDKFKSNEIMNIGVKKGISIVELAYLIKEIAGWKGDFVFDTSKPDGAMKKVLASDKMRRFLGWEPSTSLLEGVRQTIIWYNKHRKQGI